MEETWLDEVWDEVFLEEENIERRSSETEELGRRKFGMKFQGGIYEAPAKAPDEVFGRRKGKLGMRREPIRPLSVLTGDDASRLLFCRKDPPDGKPSYPA